MDIRIVIIITIVIRRERFAGLSALEPTQIGDKLGAIRILFFTFGEVAWKRKKKKLTN